MKRHTIHTVSEGRRALTHSAEPSAAAKCSAVRPGGEREGAFFVHRLPTGARWRPTTTVHNRTAGVQAWDMKNSAHGPLAARVARLLVGARTGEQVDAPNEATDARGSSHAGLRTTRAIAPTNQNPPQPTAAPTDSSRLHAATTDRATDPFPAARHERGGFGLRRRLLHTFALGRTTKERGTTPPRAKTNARRRAVLRGLHQRRLAERLARRHVLLRLACGYRSEGWQARRGKQTIRRWAALTTNLGRTGRAPPSTRLWIQERGVAGQARRGKQTIRRQSAFDHSEVTVDTHPPPAPSTRPGAPATRRRSSRRTVRAARRGDAPSVVTRRDPDARHRYAARSRCASPIRGEIPIRVAEIDASSRRGERREESSPAARARRIQTQELWRDESVPVRAAPHRTRSNPSARHTKRQRPHVDQQPRDAGAARDARPVQRGEALVRLQRHGTSFHTGGPVRGR